MHKNDDFKPLADLDDYALENDGQDIRGKTLMGPAGQSLGVISELLVDKGNDRVAAVRLQGGESYPVENLERRGDTVMLRAATGAPSSDEERISIVQEEMRVGKRTVGLGGVSVQSRIVEEPVREQVSLREEHVSVERHPVSGQQAAVGPDAFKERSVTMTQSAQEAVVSKEARVVEEVVINKSVEDRVEQIDGTVRHTEVDVRDDRTSTSAPPRK